MSRTVVGPREFRGELAQALPQRQLSVQYQPIVDLTTTRIAAVEALVRWEHPRWGMIAPSDFIPIAERTGLIILIDQWVLGTACQQVKAWQRRFPQRPPLVGNVNLSAKLIGQASLVSDVQQTLEACELEAACLRLEVTESVLMKDTIANIRTLHALRRLGVEIAIDDFGTGYSSLSYLRWLPADVLKLDRSFVVGLGQEPRDSVIVQGLISIARGLGMTVTAEGIETEQQHAQLALLGCDRGQGYYFAPPLVPDDIATLLQREVLEDTIVGADAGGPSAEAGASGRRRVLIVDDDAHVRRLLRCALEFEGYETSVAEDGQAALEVLGRLPPNVILLDMMMPIMDGRRFSQAYLERPGHHAPIVVLTAAADAAACAAEVGAVNYLRKPFDLDAILATVASLATVSPN
jgi:EAL domain-containing protein (putative c-di-GMP-specific phosphodiesterase class I)